MEALLKSGKLARKAESAAIGYGSGPTRILVTAERLFGQKGIHNVSLRQIAAAAGQGNHSAVALHFGGKSGLIEAIVEARRPIIDEGRKRRLAKVLESDREPTLRSLLECLMMPWADDVDDDGNHPYACFLAQLMWAEEEYVLLTMRDFAPVFDELMMRVRACVPHLDDAELSFRLRLIIQMFLTTVLHNGRVPLSRSDEGSGRLVFAKIVALAATILEAPIGDPVA